MSPVYSVTHATYLGRIENPFEIWIVGKRALDHLDRFGDILLGEVDHLDGHSEACL